MEVNTNEFQITEYKNKWKKSVLFTSIFIFVLLVLIILLNIYNDFIYQVIGRAFINKESINYNNNLYCEKVGLIAFTILNALSAITLALFIVFNKVYLLDDKDYVFLSLHNTKKENDFYEMFSLPKDVKYNLSSKGKVLNIFKNVLDYFGIVLLATFTVVFLFTFIIFPAEVNQSSMEKTLYDGNRVIVNVTRKIEKGDIIVFEYDKDIQLYNLGLDDDLLIKRVIATSGDSFSCQNGLIFINGSALNEDYVDSYNIDHDSYDIYDIARCNSDPLMLEMINENGGKVPEGYAIVLGDNRRISNDSENFGLIKLSQVKGKVIFYQDDFGWHKMK